jgi:hypothetical protein
VVYWGQSQAQAFQLAQPAGLPVGVVLGERQSCLESRAAGRGDGFRSGGGEQAPTARKRRAMRRLPSWRSGQAPGCFSLSCPRAGGGLGGGIEVRSPLKAQLTGSGMADVTQGDVVAVA